jgi:hypothetical protein
MNPTIQTKISMKVARECDAELNYQFQERSGMCMDAGLTVEQADAEAYWQLFGMEWKQ